MTDKRIKFEEKYEDEEYGTTTLYFIAPKEMLDGKYPEAEHAEISIEFPTANPEPAYAIVEMSPTKYDEESESYTDFDWFDVSLPYGEIEELMALASRGAR